MRGHGPLSNASRAAETARLTSAYFASATLKYTSSVAGAMISIFASLEGMTHCPPMKNRSGLLMGACVMLAVGMGSSFMYWLVNRGLVAVPQGAILGYSLLQSAPLIGA